MPATATRFGVKDPYDPEQNLRASGKYLRFLNDRYKGDLDLTLAGYNAGEGNVDKYKGIPPFKETRNYVPGVKKRLAKITGSNAFASPSTANQETTPTWDELVGNTSSNQSEQNEQIPTWDDLISGKVSPKPQTKPQRVSPTPMPTTTSSPNIAAPRKPRVEGGVRIFDPRASRSDVLAKQFGFSDPEIARFKQDFGREPVEGYQDNLGLPNAVKAKDPGRYQQFSVFLKNMRSKERQNLDPGLKDPNSIVENLVVPDSGKNQRLVGATAGSFANAGTFGNLNRIQKVITGADISEPERLRTKVVNVGTEANPKYEEVYDDEANPTGSPIKEIASPENVAGLLGNLAGFRGLSQGLAGTGQVIGKVAPQAGKVARAGQVLAGTAENVGRLENAGKTAALFGTAGFLGNPNPDGQMGVGQEIAARIKEGIANGATGYIAGALGGVTPSVAKEMLTFTLPFSVKTALQGYLAGMPYGEIEKAVTKEAFLNATLPAVLRLPEIGRTSKELSQAKDFEQRTRAAARQATGEVADQQALIESAGLARPVTSDAVASEVPTGNAADLDARISEINKQIEEEIATSQLLNDGAELEAANQRIAAMADELDVLQKRRELLPDPEPTQPPNQVAPAQPAEPAVTMLADPRFDELGNTRSAGEISRIQLERQAKGQNLSPQDIKRLTDLQRLFTADPITGFEIDQNIQPTLNAAKRNAKESSYAKVEIVNVAAANNAYANPLAANDVIGKYADIIREELTPLNNLGGKVNFFRGKGPQFEVVASGVSKDLLNEALGRAKTRIEAEVVKPLGLDKLASPKLKKAKPEEYQATLGKSGSGIEYGLETIDQRSSAQIRESASNTIEANYSTRASSVNKDAFEEGYKPQRPTRQREPEYLTRKARQLKEGDDFATPQELLRQDFNDIAKNIKPDRRGAFKAIVDKLLLKDDLLRDLGENKQYSFLGPSEREFTARRALEYTDQTAIPSFYAEFDFRNVGGLNNLGRIIADGHLKKFAEIIAKNLDPKYLGNAKVSLFRHGGDEVSAIIVGAYQKTIQLALDKARLEVDVYVKAQKLQDLEHPKGSLPGTGIVDGLGKFEPFDQNNPLSMRERVENTLEKAGRTVEEKKELLKEQHQKAEAAKESAKTQSQQEVTTDGQRGETSKTGVTTPTGRSSSVAKSTTGDGRKTQHKGATSRSELRAVPEGESRGSDQTKDLAGKTEGQTESNSETGSRGSKPTSANATNKAKPTSDATTTTAEAKNISEVATEVQQDPVIETKQELVDDSLLKKQTVDPVDIAPKNEPPTNQTGSYPPEVQSKLDVLEADYKRRRESGGYSGNAQDKGKYLRGLAIQYNNAKKAIIAQYEKAQGQGKTTKNDKPTKLYQESINPEKLTAPDSVSRRKLWNVIATHGLVDTDGKRLSFKQAIETTDKVLLLMDTFARSTGKDVDTWYKETFSNAISMVKPNGKVDAKGATEFLKNGQAVLKLFQGADASTLVHESFHIFRRQLNTEENATLNKWLTTNGFTDVDLNDTSKTFRNAEEFIARAGENYLRSGKLPDHAPSMLKQVFDSFGGWIKGIYDRLQSGGKIKIAFGKGVKKFFDEVQFDEQARGVFEQRFIRGSEQQPKELTRNVNETLRPTDSNIPRNTREATLASGERDTTPFYNLTGSGEVKTRSVPESARPYLDPELAKQVPEQQYNTLGNSETAQAASNLIAAKPDDALAMATGDKSGALENEIAIQMLKTSQEQGDFKQARQIIDALARRATESGRAIQILSRISNVSPEGIVRYAERLIEKESPDVPATVKKQAETVSDQLTEIIKALNETAPVKEAVIRFFQKNILPNKLKDRVLDAVGKATSQQGQIQAIQETVKKHYGIPVLTEVKAQQFYEMAKAAQKLTGRDQEIASALMAKAIGQEIKSTIGQKANFLLRAADLVNPAGWIANTLADLAYSSPKGFENVSDNFAAFLDVVGNSIGLFKQRSQVRPQKEKGEYRANIKNVWEEITQNIDTTNSTTKGIDISSGVPFKGKWAQYIDSAVRAGYGLTQSASYRTAKAESIRNQMKVAELNGQKLTAPTQEMITRAEKEAEARTFTDENNISAALKALKTGANELTGSKEFGAGSMFLTYTQVPGSLLHKGIKFSPLGLYKLYKLFTVRSPNFDQREFVREMSRTLLGTGVTLGSALLLHAAGILVKQSDDNDEGKLRQLEAQQGIKGYTLNLNGLGRYLFSGLDPEAAKLRDGDNLLNYEFAQPFGFLMNLGANLNESRDKAAKGEIKDTVWEIVKGYTNAGIKTLSDTSIAESLTDARQTSVKSGGSWAENLLKSVATRFTPALLRQTRNYFDNTKRETNDPDSLPNTIANSLKDSIPGASSSLPKQKSTFGDDKPRISGNNGLRDSFLWGGKLNEYKADKESETATIIFEGRPKGNERAAHIPYAGKVTINGVEKTLTGEEKARYQEYYGKEARKIYQLANKSSIFNRLHPEKQGKVIQKYLKIAKQKADIEILGDNPPKKDKILKRPILPSKDVFDHNLEVDAKVADLLDKLKTNKDWKQKYDVLNGEQQEHVKKQINSMFNKARIDEVSEDPETVQQVQANSARRTFSIMKPELQVPVLLTAAKFYQAK